jgi:hypothetical protein
MFINCERHLSIKATKMSISFPERRADKHKWLMQFKEVKENWLDEVKAERTGSNATAGCYLDSMVQFCRFMKADPAEIVARGAEEVRKDAQEEAKGGLVRKTWGDRTALEFFNWMQTQPKKKQKNRKSKLWGRTAAKSAYGAARSFLRHNGFLFKGKTPIAQPTESVKLPSNDQLTQAWKMAPLSQKLAVGLLRSTMWRPEDVLALTFGDLQDQHNPQRFYIENVTQKEDLSVGVYLTAETTEIVRLSIRKRYGDAKMNPNDRILGYNYNNLLTHVQNFGQNIGLKLSPKYFRKMGRTRCAPVIGQDAVFKMAGWTLPGVGRNYVLPSPEDTLKCYLQIEPLLTFEPRAAIDKEQARQNVKNFAIAQGIPPEVAERMASIWREKALTPEEAAVDVRAKIEEALQKKRQQETATNGDCSDGAQCQRIVIEDELPDLLAHSWHVVCSLPSGKIVVSNE